MKLETPTKEDCEIVRQWRNQDISGLRTPYFLTKEQQENFYKDVINERSSRDRYWSIYDEDKFIGFGGITNIQWENSIGEISLIINPKYRDNGFGKESVELILDEAFNRMNLKTVFGECYMIDDKWKFWKSVLRTPYVMNLPNRKYWNGKYYDSFYFSVDRNIYAK